MTATDELHGQLDTGYPHTLRLELHKALRARGVDYWVAQGLTFWSCPDGRECVAYGYQANGKPRLAVKIVGITDPEQAIAATLGRGECHLLSALQYGDDCKECSACGAVFDEYMFKSGRCPSCRAKVVDGC